MWIGPSSEKNDEGPTLSTSAYSLRWPIFFVNSSDKTKSSSSVLRFASKYQHSTMPNEYSEDYGYFYLTV